MSREINNALASCGQRKLSIFFQQDVEFLSKGKSHVINAKFIKLIEKIFPLKHFCRLVQIYGYNDVKLI